MIILIDTNIFFNNWFLNNANFKYLFNYLENTDSYIYLPQVVCEEVDGKFKSEKNSIKTNLVDSISKLQNFSEIEFSIEIPNSSSEYSFKKQISKRTDNVVFIPYDNVSNKELVDRAIKRIKPFQNEDKGFRDTLLWLSFLNYLKQHGKDETVSFIDNNPIDFFNKNKTDLHSDLKDDITKLELKNEFKIFSSIKEFIESVVDKDDHEFTSEFLMENFIDDLERELEDDISSFFNTNSEKWFLSMIEKVDSPIKDMAFISGIDFVIHEGIEDSKLLNWTRVGENNLFIELYLNLRIVELRFDIPTASTADMSSKQRAILFDSVTDGERTSVSTYTRPHLNISFNLSLEEPEVTDLVINSIDLL